MRPFWRTRAAARLRNPFCALLTTALVGVGLFITPAAVAQTSQAGATTKAIALTNGFVSIRERLAAARAQQNITVASTGAGADRAALVAPRDVRRRWFAKLNTRLVWLESEIEKEQNRLGGCDKENCWGENGKKAWHAAVKRVGQADDPIREAQRLVHHDIRYRWDRPGKDHWQTPLETLARGRGDCEDHAILKRALLIAAGVDESKVSLVFMRTARGLGHVIVQVETEEGTRILDNRTNAQRIGRLLPGDEVLAVHRTVDPLLLADRSISQAPRS